MAGASSRSTIAVFSDLSENGIPSNDPAQSHKRIRACIACRNMKIKCVSVPGSRDCEACLRFSRPCQDPGPPKTRVKTSQKFTELEKKIDALTNALDAERRRNQQSLQQVMVEAQWSRTPDSNGKDDASEVMINDGRVNGKISGDIVDQGLIDMPTAGLLFDHWNLRMRPLMPVIRFSAEENVHTIRTKKPTLFLTIMTIASTSTKPSLMPHLLTRLNNTLAQDVFIQGAKSLDLLQSLILFSQYYIQPPNVRAFAMPQHTYSAVVMSHDLGLDTLPKSNEKEKESCRTLLAVYFGASCAATLLGRHQPVMFTSSRRDCIEALMQADNRQRDDQWLCSLVALQEILDDVSKTLNTSFINTDESFEDFKTQHLLGIFRQRLASWKEYPQGDIDPRLRNHAASIADLYIHQVAIRVYNRQMLAWLNSKEKNGPQQQPPVFTVTLTDALCHCLRVSSNVLNIYISLDDATARSLSNLFLVWNMCAAVCLIKLGYFAEDLSHYRTSNDGSYDLPSPLDLLEAMIQKLTSLSLHGYFPQSQPFIVAFRKLKMWFLQKKLICIKNDGNCEDGSNRTVHEIFGAQTPPASPPATESTIHIPPQAGIDDLNRLRTQLEFQPEQNGPTAIPEVQQIGRQSLDWEPSLSHINAPQPDNAFEMTYDPSYIDTDLGDLGFNMENIDNFMMQADDEGLWSLL